MVYRPVRQMTQGGYTRPVGRMVLAVRLSTACAALAGSLLGVTIGLVGCARQPPPGEFPLTTAPGSPSSVFPSVSPTSSPVATPVPVPPARADTNTFLTHVHALGFTDGTARPATPTSSTPETPPATPSKTGNSISSVQSLAETILGAKGAPAASADKFVTYAIADLCPAAGGDPR
jgi:hypothetical protein